MRQYYFIIISESITIIYEWVIACHGFCDNGMLLLLLLLQKLKENE